MFLWCPGCALTWVNATDNCHTTDDMAHPPGPRFARPALVLLAVGVGGGSAAANAMGAFFVLSAVSIGESDTPRGPGDPRRPASPAWPSASGSAYAPTGAGPGTCAWSRSRKRRIGPLMLAMVDPR